MAINDYTDELNASDDIDKNMVSAERKIVIDNQRRGQAKAYKDIQSSDNEQRKFVSNHTHSSTVEPVLGTLVNYLGYKASQ